jgi:hypothetical protein
MSRKKRIDPPALDSFLLKNHYGEDKLYEIRDETCVVKDRGYINRELYRYRLWNLIMPKVVNDYLDKNGRKYMPPSRDYLASPTKFANKIVNSGLHFSGDICSLRKCYYPDVKKHIQYYENAIRDCKSK